MSDVAHAFKISDLHLEQGDKAAYSWASRGAELADGECMRRIKI